MSVSRPNNAASQEEPNKKKREDEAASYKQMEDRINYYLNQRGLTMSHWRNERTREALLTQDELEKEKALVGENGHAHLSSGDISHIHKQLSEGKWTYGDDKFSVVVKDGGWRPSRLPRNDTEFNAMWGRLLDAKIMSGATMVTLNFDEERYPWTKHRVEMFLQLAEDRGIGVQFGDSMDKFLEGIRKNDETNPIQNAISYGKKETDYERLMTRMLATHDGQRIANTFKNKHFEEQAKKLSEEKDAPALLDSLKDKTGAEKLDAANAEVDRRVKQIEGFSKGIDDHLTSIGDLVDKVKVNPEVNPIKSVVKQMAHKVGINRDVYETQPAINKLAMLEDVLKGKNLSGKEASGHKALQKAIEDEIKKLKEIVVQLKNDPSLSSHEGVLGKLESKRNELQRELMVAASEAKPEKQKEIERLTGEIDKIRKLEEPDKDKVAKDVAALEDKIKDLEGRASIEKQHEKVEDLSVEIEKKKEEIRQFAPKNTNIK